MSAGKMPAAVFVREEIQLTSQDAGSKMWSLLSESHSLNTSGKTSGQKDEFSDAVQFISSQIRQKEPHTCLRSRVISGLLTSMSADSDGKLSL